MSLDLHDPIAAGRSATQAVQRHAAEAVDRARDVDLPDPAQAVAHAGRKARRAAKQLRREMPRATKRSAKRAWKQSRRMAKAEAGRRRGRKALVAVLVVAGGAAVVAVLAKRLQQVEAAETVPDPFGTGVRMAEPGHAHDGHSVTTG
jgi:hypothetical protein